MLQVARLDPDNLKQYNAWGGRYNTWEDLKFDDPNCIAAFAEKRKGVDLSAPWLFWNDEVWYIIQGELELDVCSPPMFNDHQIVVVRPGDLVWVKMGHSITSRVLSDEPVRFCWVSMPRPRYFGNEEFWEDKPSG